MPSPPEVVVAGHICLDLIPETHKLAKLDPGDLARVGEALFTTGGVVSNTGIALHKLGVEVRLMGKVGQDLFGQKIIEIINSHNPGLAQDMIGSQNEATSYSVVVNFESDRSFLHYPGCNDTFTSDDIDWARVEGAKILHFGYPPLMKAIAANEGRQLVKLLKKAKELNLITSLDMAAPVEKQNWNAVLDQALPFVDIFVPSKAELNTLLNLNATAEELGRICLKKGAKTTIIKCGAEGLHLTTASEQRTHGTFEVEVAGTTGSGDATIAGYLFGVLKGFSAEECLRAACAVGACSVERPDAVSGIPPWPEIEKRLESGWRTRKGTTKP